MTLKEALFEAPSIAANLRVLTIATHLKTPSDGESCREKKLERRGARGDLAEKKVKRLVGRVSDSMDLEAQGVASRERQRQLEEVVDEMLRNRGQDFWDV